MARSGKLPDAISHTLKPGLSATELIQRFLLEHMNDLETPFLEHKGVSVFHVYQGNGAPLGCWFSWEKTEFEVGESTSGAQFDIRDLPGYVKPKKDPASPIAFTESSAHEGPALWGVHGRDQQLRFLRAFIEEHLGETTAPWLPFTGTRQRVTVPTIEARYTPDKRAIKTAAKSSTGIFQFLKSLVPDAEISITPEELSADALEPIATEELENEWDDPDFHERRKQHVTRVQKWEKILRPLVRRSECHYRSDNPWWLSRGPEKVMEEIGNPLPSIVSRRTPPTHLINEIRHTKLRRALLLRQAKIDRKTIDRKRLWLEINPAQGSTHFFAHYSVPRQEKLYHWEEVAVSTHAGAFIQEVLNGMHSTTELVSVWGRHNVDYSEARNFYAQLEAELVSAGFFGRVELF